MVISLEVSGSVVPAADPDDDGGPPMGFTVAGAIVSVEDAMNAIDFSSGLLESDLSGFSLVAMADWNSTPRVSEGPELDGDGAETVSDVVSGGLGDIDSPAGSCMAWVGGAAFEIGIGVESDECSL